jgi:DNA segregation ATPase FtsK/SpoIIIE, S-DNA-T family
MAAKRKAGKAAPKNSPPKHGGSSGSFEIFKSKPFWWAVAVFTVGALLIVFRDSVKTFIDNVRTSLGLGAFLILALIIIVLVLAIRRRLDTFIKHWHVWLGSLSFMFALWGIFGLSDYNNNKIGGWFGYYLVGGPSPFSSLDTFIGVVIIAAFIIVGFLLVAPKVSTKMFGWLWELLKGKPRDKAEKRPAAPDAKQTPVQRTVQRNVPATIVRPQRQMEPQETIESPDYNKKMKKPEDLADKTASTKPPTEKPQIPTRKEEPVKAALSNGKEVAPINEPVKTDKAKPEEPSGETKQIAEEIWKKYGQAANLVEIDGWHLPPVNILDASPEVQFTDEDNQQRAKLIEETLQSYGVDASIVEINAGPTVTQFGVEPGWDIKYKEIKQKGADGKTEILREEISRTRVKVERISSLANDMALALAAPTIRIEAPVPGKTFVGVEVPNITSDMVSLRGVIETQSFQKMVTKTKMAIALGKGAGGESISADLTKMPHLLIAGSTGSGKTVCLNTIVCCLIMNNTPDDVRFILIDPKRVELVQYNSMPHLATPVIVETPRALAALRWLCQEMDDRYKKFATSGSRHIEGYNKNKTGTDKMPYLVLIIDELADLMMAGFNEVETNLCRLAQLARATGIHLVVATQRPSVDVVTGLIKANFPTRISFAVTSQVDSRTILDSIGAEKLLGKGDMLYMPTDAAKPRRLQGCFMSDAEIERIVYFWGSQRKEEPDTLRMQTLVETTPAGTIGGHPRDALLEQALELARTVEDVSTSFLQRRLHIGYPRAARLKEQLDAVLSGRDSLNRESGDMVDESDGVNEEEAAGEDREET